ncbi:MAG: stage V sporulation protein AA [Caldicoprobacterales bacterium]|jgi:stage V sporulation protein AA|nr:hypothetical protein [Clostridiales bacterium]
MGSNEVYFQFKPYYQKQSGQKANLGDFIELSAAEDIKKRIENIPVFPYGISRPVRLTSVQIIGLIKQEINNISVTPIGESSALYKPAKRKKENPLLVFLRVAFSMLLLFFGSALAIMYFHSDVNMNEAHKMIYYLISGEKVSRPVLFSLSYSVGIGAGIFIFFEVYNKIKNKDNPGPLELEMHQSEKELRDYLRDQEGKKQA